MARPATKAEIAAEAAHDLTLAGGAAAGDIAPRLLDWYDRHRRRLPWRAEPGEATDPYIVWLSEIMLQQTTVATVGDYFARFTARWPTVEALAVADLDDVLTEWAGLGYYARARNLHACARMVSAEHGGRFPDTEEGLRALPGIGAYTAAAIAAIAFGRRAVVMDGNIERVTARLFAVETPLPAAKPVLHALTDRITPARRAGDFAQAMMDLGATICVPRSPRCMLCPLSAPCAGQGIAARLPAKAPKKAKPTRRAVAFWIERPDGAVLIRRRPESGLLGGMMEVPSSEWRADESPAIAQALTEAPIPVESAHPVGTVRHTFTHFHLELAVARVAVPDDAAAPEACRWVMPDGLGGLALPTVMRKVAERALGATP
ncbi:A/G-specific adenine glycosylase [Marivibrio halodurans]|uniref:Adenine DNA glycosylase n=1 Tax=Marivibrio halodurans TaxID=2039722 RepID=A0A8J7S4J2_9PROT|nr:A/G-specific adenine glycosylase [Marivibrio halodurans]MBP5856599.1 A/G-specific adenine glycosylase [Marivibrio halodurans]